MNISKNVKIVVLILVFSIISAGFVISYSPSSSPITPNNQDRHFNTATTTTSSSTFSEILAKTTNSK